MTPTSECYADAGIPGALAAPVLRMLSRRYQNWRGIDPRGVDTMSGAFRGRLRARLLLEWALHRRGCELASAEVHYGRHGKPTIPASGVHFNLAHDGDAVAVAVGSEEVGVDLTAAEHFRPAVREVLALLSGLPANEFASLDRTSLRERWATAEAVIKANGLSLLEIALALPAPHRPGPLTGLSHGLRLSVASRPLLSVAVATHARDPAPIHWLDEGELEDFATVLFHENGFSFRQPHV